MAPVLISALGPRPWQMDSELAMGYLLSHSGPRPDLCVLAECSGGPRRLTRLHTLGAGVIFEVADR